MQINNAGIAGGVLDSYSYAKATELAGGNWVSELFFSNNLFENLIN